MHQLSHTLTRRSALGGLTAARASGLVPPGAVAPDIAAIPTAGGPAPDRLTKPERAAFDALQAFYRDSSAHAAMMVTRPQIIGDSQPALFAAEMRAAFRPLRAEAGR
jgi:hypothetical protein